MDCPPVTPFIWETPSYKEDSKFWKAAAGLPIKMVAGSAFQGAKDMLQLVYLIQPNPAVFSRWCQKGVTDVVTSLIVKVLILST